MKVENEQRRFVNKVVLVTGAANGIGFVTAALFAHEGANVVAMDLPGAPFARLIDHTKSFDGCIETVEMDVSQADDWTRAIEVAQNKFEGIDILVNCAGISGPMGRLEECAVEAFDQTLSVNVRGVFLGMQAVIDPIRDRGSGNIINVSSVSGQRGNTRILPYVASKHAVDGMSKCAALDLIEYGIRVNVVSPAPTNTNMMKSLEDKLTSSMSISEEEAQKILSSNIPMKRYGEPSEIAAVIAFLCSNEASFMTGAIVNVDGGILAY